MHQMPSTLVQQRLHEQLQRLVEFFRETIERVKRHQSITERADRSLEQSESRIKESKRAIDQSQQCYNASKRGIEESKQYIEEKVRQEQAKQQIKKDYGMRFGR